MGLPFENQEYIEQGGIGGNTLFVDDINKRVGINIANPTEDLDIDGNIQLNSANTGKIVFYDSNDSHKHAEIDATDDGATGGQLQFHTKIDGGATTEKLRINNVGAIGIGGANYGTSGQVLTSNTSGSAVSWTNIGSSISFKATSNNTSNFTFSSGHQLFSAELINVAGHKGSFNDGSAFNPSTGLFTAPEAGLYYFGALVFWETSAPSFNASYVRVSITTPATSTDIATALLVTQFGANEAFNTNFSQSTSGIIKLNANDTIGLYVFANNAPNANISKQFSYFMGYKIV